LERAGFAVRHWTDGRPLAGVVELDVALVVLDLMLPDGFGLDLLKALRTRFEVPVLVLSALADSAHKVRALQLGADDYMTKPFWPEELVERVRARLRRPTMQRADGAMEVGALRLDEAARSATLAGEPV